MNLITAYTDFSILYKTHLLTQTIVKQLPNVEFFRRILQNLCHRSGFDK